MSKHLIKKETTAHGTISWAHDGKDGQYCEAGEVVAIDWQPSAGWGLQEAHYTDSDGNVVAIDIEVREFTMPAKNITIGGTFKKFVVQDWTTNDKSQDGKGIGIDENGNLVPVELYDGSVTGSEGYALQVGSDGKPVSNSKVNFTADGDVLANGNVSANGKVTADGDVSAGGNVSASGDGYFGTKGNASSIYLYDSNNPSDRYRISVENGALICTQV